MAAAARVLAIATVFVAAPAIADNPYWDPRQSRHTGFYANTPLEECQRGSQGDLELRACLSRLLLEAESAYGVYFELLESVVQGQDDEFMRAEEAEALRFSRETWRQYLDFQCDFEGAMLGETYSARSLQATSCRVSLLRNQTARISELVTQIDEDARPGSVPGGGGVIGEARFRDWTARCTTQFCAASTESGQGRHRLEIAQRGPEERVVVFSSDTFPVDPSRAIAVRVDGSSPVVFRPYSGYRAEDGVFVLSESRAVATLLRSMRRGGRLTVQFVDVEGADRLATFSLFGVSDSLSWIEDRRGGRAVFTPTAGRL
ncbi:MAG: lysozyme inhibitor LprI family protein [Oceanicaulis sp.]